jgi:hypothetical protein
MKPFFCYSSYQLFSFFVIIVLVLNTRLSTAQILVGPVIGGQINQMVFDDQSSKDFYNLKPIFNFHAGASVSFRAQKRFFLQTSILYTQKGKLLESKDNAGTRNDTKFRYIDIPILYTAEFKAKLGREKVYKWYFGVGPTVSYWLGGKGVLIHGDLNENFINPPNYDLHYKIVFNKDSASVNTDEMNVREPNRIQLGLNASAGLIFEPFGKHKIMVNFRYAFGQSFLSRYGKGEFDLPGVLYYQDDLRVRSRELVLSLHYFTDLKTEERKKGKSTSNVKARRPRR